MSAASVVELVYLGLVLLSFLGAASGRLDPLSTADIFGLLCIYMRITMRTYFIANTCGNVVKAVEICMARLLCTMTLRPVSNASKI